ncbi:MAG: N-acetyl sugar amidotransferase [Bdellovibrionota bacterium]
MAHQQICTRCVMDTTDPKITFDDQGVCNHCHDYDNILKNWPLKQYIQNDELGKLFATIKEKQKGEKYDCIIGLSGGVDSSYIAWMASQYNLRPLCVHLDNGWNSELATFNIHSIVEKLGFDLVTHVIDWEEFRELQRAFFKAGVIDIELLSDHAIFGVIIELARKHNIKYILSGANIATEAVMPKAWVHRKQDLANIKDIFKKFGEGKLKTFPQVSTMKHGILMYGLGYKVVKPLNLIDYHKDEAKKLLQEKLDWRDYGGKHYESIFTKFYQAHILPVKFNVDKRKAHLSTLINSGQISRDAALQELKKPLYDPKELKEDTEFVLKKLHLSSDWFEKYLHEKPISHYEYKTDQWLFDILSKLRDRFRPATKFS